MLGELGIAAVLAGTGAAVVAAIGGVRRIPAICLAVPTGAAAYLFVALGMVATSGRLPAGAALATTAAMGVGAGAVAFSRRPGSAAILGWTIATALGVVAVSRLLHLTRLSPDSLRYLLAAVELGDGIGEVHPADLLKRQFGLPALQALSAFTDRRYLASLAPLFGASALGLFAWLVWDRADQGDPRRRRQLVVAGLLFAASSNRLLYDVFYINSHVQLAAYTLIAVAGSWLSVMERSWRWSLVAGTALAAGLLFRPEQPFVTALVLIPVAVFAPDRRSRVAVALPALVISLVWYGGLLWRYAPDGSEISLTAPVLTSLVVVITAGGLVLAGGFHRVEPIAALADRALLPVLALILAGFTVTQPRILVDSLSATFANLVLVEGLWMLAWPVLAGLTAVALVVHHVPCSQLWTRPVVGFALLFWLLPFAREAAWRVGTGDSGNRILAHVFLVALAFVLLAALPAHQQGVIPPATAAPGSGRSPSAPG